jgi:copper ion binding protein
MSRGADDPELLKLMKMKKTFMVNGMKCMHCKAKVEDAIQSLKGINTVKVNLEDKSASVDYDENVVSVDDLKKAVSASGRYELIG